MAYPFIKWAGGKRWLTKNLDKYLPSNFSDFTTYVEPFVGGGAMMFHVIENYPHIKKVVINDMNYKLIKTYIELKMKEHAKYICMRLSKMEEEFKSLPSQIERVKYYNNVRELFNTGGTSDADIAVYFIFLNKTCFNGLYRVNKKDCFNVPCGHQKTISICDIENLTNVTEALQKVNIITYSDYGCTIDSAGPNAFYYLDPPYKPVTETSSFTSYTADGFSDAEQERLKSFCDKLTDAGSAFLLSNSDALDTDGKPYFDKLYNEYHISRVDVARSINSKGTARNPVKEILIDNYENRSIK